MALSAKTPSRLLSVSEGEKLRDRMNGDEDKSTETLSTISRSLAVGLALIAYTFFVQKEHTPFVADNFGWLLAASAIGVLAVTADALHYLFGTLQVRQMRRLIQQQIAIDGTLSIDQLARINKNLFYGLRSTMFWGKLVLVAIGTGIVLVIISRVALAALV